MPARPARADSASMLSIDSSLAQGGMNSNWIGSFGEQWFGTMCTVSRCIHSKPNQDTAGFDFLVTDQRSETILVQVKATEQPQWRDGSLAFDLDVATYDKLRQGTTPGFLVVVVLHRRLEVIARHFGRGVVVRASGYWLRLGGLPPTNNASSRPISDDNRAASRHRNAGTNAQEGPPPRVSGFAALGRPGAIRGPLPERPVPGARSARQGHQDRGTAPRGLRCLRRGVRPGDAHPARARRGIAWPVARRQAGARSQAP